VYSFKLMVSGIGEPMKQTRAKWSANQYLEWGLQPPSIRPPIPNGPQDVSSVLIRPVVECPDKLAIIGRHDRVTFMELDQLVNDAASFLTATGIKEGDRIAASIPNGANIVVAFLASQRIGAVWVGIPRNLATPEKIHLLRDCGATAYVADRDTLSNLRDRASDLGPLENLIDVESGSSDCSWSEGVRGSMGAAAPSLAIDPWAPAAISYTSGTTGRPKGVVHTQHSIMLAALMAEQMARDTRKTVIRATPSPLTILNMMIMGPLATLAAGLTHVCMDRIDALGVAEWLSREKINTLTLVPTVILDLLTRQDIDPEDLKSVTWMVGGGAMVPEKLPELYRLKFGHPLTIGYGLTEIPTSVARSQDDTPHLQGAIGRALPHLEVMILDDDGRVLEAGKTGEICVRASVEGPWAGIYTLPLGYWHQGEATAQLLRGGCVHTGDLGYLDARHNLFIQDRRSDLIIRGGFNIYPAEIERVLRSDRRVRDVAVLGKTHERLGQVAVAFLQLLPDAAHEGVIEELRALCETEIAKYKIPEEWYLVGEMPRNAAGKVLKGQLSKSLDDGLISK
jgi:long-chain acyl-CoA synthetase